MASAVPLPPSVPLLAQYCVCTGTLIDVTTTYPRAQITLTPEVQSLIEIGRRRWPNKAPGAVLVALAQEGIAKPKPRRSAGLFIMPPLPGGKKVTNADIENALDQMDIESVNHG